MTQDNNHTILDESDDLVLSHIFEEAYLTIKTTGERISLGNFYGEPICGLISNSNDWCIVGGSELVVWTKEEITRIKDADLYWACKIRQKSDTKVEILIDPWADNSSIWEFDILTKERSKIKDFPYYKGKEYSETIIW